MAKFIVSRLFEKRWTDQEIIEAENFSSAKSKYQLRHSASFGNIKAEELGICVGCGQEMICKKFVNPKTKEMQNCCYDCIQKIVLEIKAVQG